MGKPGNTGIARIIRAFGFSMKGLQAAWQHEAAFRQELLLTVVLVPLAFVIAETMLQLALLLSTLFIVLITEIINSAIEAVVDRISSEQHELAGRAKDLGSAAVFLALVMTTVVWGLVIFQRFS